MPYKDPLIRKEKAVFYTREYRKRQLEKLNALSPEEQTIIKEAQRAKRREAYNSMDPEKKAALLAKNRVANLTPEEHERRKARDRAWFAKISDEQKETIRNKNKLWYENNKDSYNARRREQRANLSPEEKEELNAKQRVENLTEEQHERRKFLSKKARANWSPEKKEAVKLYMKNYNAEHSVEKSDYQKNYYLDHQEELIAASKARWDEKKDEIKANRKEKYANLNEEEKKKIAEKRHEYNMLPKVREEKRAYNKGYYLDNREHILEQVKECAKKNKPKVKLYRKKHYEENKEEIKAINALGSMMNKEKEMLHVTKGETPCCVLCGIKEGEKYEDGSTVYLEFHHVEPKDKFFNIGQSRLSYAHERVKRELDKCVLLCKKCHSKQTSAIATQNPFYLKLFSDDDINHIRTYAVAFKMTNDQIAKLYPGRTPMEIDSVIQNRNKSYGRTNNDGFQTYTCISKSVDNWDDMDLN